MQVTESFKILGPLSVLISWSAISFVLFARPRDITKSISHHAAMRQKEYIIYAVALTVAVICMYLFLIKWFAPVFMLSGVFRVIVTLAIVSELLATWVPLTEGLKFIVHQISSYGAAF